MRTLLVAPLLGAAALLAGCVAEPGYVDRGYSPGRVYAAESGYYDSGPSVVAVRTVERDRYVGRDRSRRGGPDRYRTSARRQPSGDGRGRVTASSRRQRPDARQPDARARKDKKKDQREN